MREQNNREFNILERYFTATLAKPFLFMQTTDQQCEQEKMDAEHMRGLVEALRVSFYWKKNYSMG